MKIVVYLSINNVKLRERKIFFKMLINLLN